MTPITAACFGSDNLSRSGEFYDRAPGMVCMETNDSEIGYGDAGV